ncbi:MAG: M28 family peptidase [Thermoproteota archaeon]
MLAENRFRSRFLKTVLISSLLVMVCLFSSFNSSRAQVEGLDFSIVRTFFEDSGGNYWIQEHVRFFTSLGSRMPGHPGFNEAASYIVSYLTRIGVEPYGDDGGFYENYTLTSVVDWGASITLENDNVLKAYMCTPNLVNTNSYKSPPEGDKVVYVGRGYVEDFDGKNINGKFVLMDFNSKWFFRYAVMFGAKGVIYIYPRDTVREEAYQKSYAVPIRFPRYLLSPTDSQKMVDYVLEHGGEATVWIDSRMTWERLNVPNIVGLIEGSDPTLKDEYIVLSAYYDSQSLFPAFAPGATESISSSVLLEVARFLVENRPKRSVIILFTSGHFQSIWGAREYVDRHFNEIGSKLKLFISLDLSYGSDQLAMMNRGTTYGYTLLQSLNAKYMPLIVKVFNTYLSALREVFGPSYGANFVDGIQLTHPSFIQSSPPLRFGPSAYDSEPFTVAAFGGGVTFVTVNDMLTYHATPLDTFDKVNFKNVYTQAYFVAAISYALPNEPSLPLSAGRPSKFSSEWGYATLNLTVATYNLTTNFFDTFHKERDPEVWNDLIVMYVGGTQGVASNVAIASTPPSAAGGVSGALQVTGVISVIAKPDEHGTVTIKGLKPFTGQNAPSTFFAFAINSTDGTVYMALDSGAFGAGRIGGNYVLISSERMTKLVPIFECGSILIQNVLNPRDLTSSLTPVIYNAFSHGPMIHWSQWTGSFLFGDHMFFVEIGTPAEIILYYSGAGAPTVGQLQAVGGAGAATYVWGALTNFTGAGARRLGYVVREKGESIIINYAPYEYARELFLLNNERVSTAKEYGVSSPMIILYHGLAEECFQTASQALIGNQYSAVYGLAYAAWGYEQRAYYETLSLVQNAIFTTSLFFLLLIPFAYVFERLVFNYVGLRRVFTMMMISFLLVLVLFFFHPGFHLANNLLMILIGLGVVAIIIPLLSFLYSEASATTRAVSSRILGIHSMASSVGAVFSTALGLGVQWMRKRPFRSTLTLASITIITFALMTFTSLASVAIPRVVTRTDVPISYSGVLIRQRPWSNIPTELWVKLKYEFEGSAYVAARGWYFPPAGPGTKGFIYWNAQNLTARVYGVLAMSYEEQLVSGVWDRIKVRGRWFYPEETFSVLISTALASDLTQELGYTIGPGSQLPLWGLNLTVIGLFDGDALYSGSGTDPTSGFIDLDGEPITPRDPTAPAGGMQAIPPHLSGRDVIIIPFDLALKIFGSGFQPMSIAIKPFNNSDVETLASRLAYRLNTLVIYGLAKSISIEGWPIGDISEVTTRAWFSFIGAETLIVPLVIASVSILNITIGAIYERIKSLSVYVVVGATPSQTAGIFLSESIVYGILSSVFGYILGVVGVSVMMRLGAYTPDFFPNFASSFILVVVALALFIPLIATVQPAVKAWRLVTPSLERKWKIPEPVGDYWTIPLPFVATDENELMGIMAFIREFLESSMGTEKTGLFATEAVGFSEQREGDKTIKRLSAKIRLAPFDLAIMEDFEIEAVTQMKRYNMTLRFVRTSGILKNWITSNKAFIDVMRKQFLIWRTLPPSEREYYIGEAGKKLRELSQQGGG